MATNQSIQGADLDSIQQSAGVATRNAIALLYNAWNVEISARRREVREAKNILAPKVLALDLGANQNNMDLEGSSLLLLTGASARNISGFRAPSTGQSRVLIIHNVGAGTITLRHANAASDAENRIRTTALADLAVATDASVVLLYLNGLWRQQSVPVGVAAPAAHAASHENGGADEISVAGLSGLLGDAQVALPHSINGVLHTFPGPAGATFLNDLGVFVAPGGSTAKEAHIPLIALGQEMPF